jgi:hypothetical protein
VRKVVVATLIGLVTPGLAACSPSPGPSPRASIQTTSTTSAANVAVEFMNDLSTEEAADNAYTSAFDLVNLDIIRQSQKIDLDKAAITNDESGAGCIATASINDPSTYPSCVSSEEQTAANARTDLGSALSRDKQDYSQYADIANKYAAVLSAFISQVIKLRWASQYNQAAEAVVSTARMVRTDLENAGAITESTLTSRVSLINVHSAIDRGNFSDALSALRSKLASAPTRTSGPL